MWRPDSVFSKKKKKRFSDLTTARDYRDPLTQGWQGGAGSRGGAGQAGGWYNDGSWGQNSGTEAR